MPAMNTRLPDTLDPPHLVLGSSSPYRRELLARLRLPFEVHSPHVDEAAAPGELPLHTAQRLSVLKARAVATLPALQGKDVLVIGSDQVAELNGQPMGKPGSHDKARAQLQAMRGQVVQFHTSVTVLRPVMGYEQETTSTSVVHVRALTDADIDRYLALEQPYDCAGSAKAESLGICLLGRIESSDPTALIGLPLIETTRLLREAGLDPLHACSNPAPTP
jgi:septum formation protein